MANSPHPRDAESSRQQVRAGYAQVARAADVGPAPTPSGCCSGSSCCGAPPAQVDIRLKTRPEYVAAMSDWKDPLYARIVAALPAGTTPADFVTSLNVTARKPQEL